MTRAEAAQTFYNLLVNKDVMITVSFDDVSDDAWYADAVNTLASLGILKGIGSDLYAPRFAYYPRRVHRDRYALCKARCRGRQHLQRR